MFVKRLKTIGGISSLARYVSALAGIDRYVPTTNSTAVFLPVDASPYMQVQNWFNGTTTGFNGKYADPAVLLPYYSRDSSWSRAKGYLSVGFDLSPYVRTYTFNDSTGFGSAYSNPSTLPAGPVKGIDLQVDSSLIFMAHATTPYMSGYPFSTASGYGTKFADPATTIGSNGVGIKYFNETLLVSSDVAAPFLHAYQFSAFTGFGTKYSNPTGVGSYGGYFAEAHPLGNAVASGRFNPDVYAWSKANGFGTRYTGPSEFIYAYSLVFSSTGNTILMGGDQTPFISAYPFTVGGGFGSKFSNPATLPTTTPYYNNVAFSFGAQAAAITSTTSPYVYAYQFSESTGFGTKYSNPAGTLRAVGSFGGGINFN
jgi:hypothetical protein